MELPIDTYNLLLMFHLFGIAIGAGGAFASDLTFFSSIKDRHISRTEARMMATLSKMVWLGVIILVVSGIGIIWMNPGFLSLDKFQAKITIVTIVILNGAVFHFKHLPVIKRSHTQEFSKNHELVQKRIGLLISGVVSMVSWSSAIILGIIRFLPYNYPVLMGIYAFLILGGIITSFVIKERIIPSK